MSLLVCIARLQGKACVAWLVVLHAASAFVLHEISSVTDLPHLIHMSCLDPPLAERDSQISMKTAQQSYSVNVLAIWVQCHVAFAVQKCSAA